MSEMNYVLLILLFMVYFCHLVVKKHSREKSTLLKPSVTIITALRNKALVHYQQEGHL